MKSYFNNKKGSTLILLVMAIAVISLLGTSILGVTMMNFKIKKTNTAIKEAFYKSESGLDIAYDDSYTLVLDAVDYANDSAKLFLNQFTLENIVSLLTYHYDCISIKNVDGIDEYTFKEDVIKGKAKKEFVDNFYKYITKASHGTTHNNIVKVLENINLNPIVSIDNDSISFNGNKLIIDGTDDLISYDGSVIDVNEGDILTIGIESLYSKDGIKKTTSVNLEIEVPKYDEPYTVTTKVIPVNPFWTKVLIANDLYFEGNNNNSTIFNDDVFISNNLVVKGNDINPNFNGKVAVRGNIELGKKGSAIINSDITTNGDVFANNIILYAKKASLNSNNNFCIKDDLEMNNAEQEVDINGSYYGFSNGEDGPDTSSSIIINDESINKLNITGDLYLYGSSYVGGTDKYQTGESVSVIGNYKAYMSPLENEVFTTGLDKNNLKYTNIDFIDYGDLNFANSFYTSTGRESGKLNVFDKSDYIYYYHNEYMDLKIPSIITLGNVHSVGSVINNSTLENWSYDNNVDPLVYITKEKDYNREVERLGYESVNFATTETDELLFDVQVNTSTDQILLDDMSAISKGGDGTLYFEGIYGKEYKGIIITNESIVISGNIDFTGSIICGDKVTIFEDGKEKNFKYDKNLVARLISENNLYKSVFKEDTIPETITITSFENIDGGVENVNFSQLIGFKNWNIK